MPTLTSATLWKTASYSYKPYLHIYLPPTIYTARVNQSEFSYPLAQVSYDGGVGTLADVRIGMTVLLGTTPGAEDRGRTFVRKTPTSNTLYIGLSSRGRRRGEVDVQDNLYITIIALHEVWFKPPRFDINGVEIRNEEAFSNDIALAPVANGGTDILAFINPAFGTLETSFDGSDSFAQSGTIAAWEWDFGDGSPGTFNGVNPVGVSFPPGARYVYLTVLDNTGRQHTTAILVVALERTGVNAPYPGGIDEIEQRLRLWQTFVFRLTSPLDPTAYFDGTKILYMEEEYYDNGIGSLVGPDAVRGQLKFSGWLQNSPSSINQNQMGRIRQTRYQAVDAAGRLAALGASPWTARRKAAATKWNEITGATLDLFMVRSLRDFSTALEVAPFKWAATGAVINAFATRDADGSNMYQLVDGIAQQMRHRFGCDLRGNLLVKRVPLLYDTADRTNTVIVGLDENDYTNVDYDDQSPTVGQLNASAEIINTFDADGVVVPPPLAYAQSPAGDATGQGGGRRALHGVLIEGQLKFNAWVGHLYAWLNAMQGEFRIPLVHMGDAGIYPILQEWVTLTIPEDDAAPRPLVLTDERMLPTELYIRHQFSERGSVKSVRIAVIRETIGTPAKTIPAPPTISVYVPPDGNLPPDNPVNPPPLFKGTRTIASFWTDNVLRLTGPNVNGSGFDIPSVAGGPNYVDIALASVSGWGGGTVCDGAVDAFCSAYLQQGTSVDGWVCTDTHVGKLSSAFGARSFSGVHTFSTDMQTSIKIMQFERGTRNWGIVVSYKYLVGVRVAYTTDGLNWTEPSVPAAFNNYDTTPGSSIPPALYVSPYVEGLARITIYTSTGTGAGLTTALYETTDYGATWVLITNPNVQAGNLLAVNLHIPYQDTAETTVFYAKSNGAIAGYDPRLMRVIGSGSPVDVSPQVGGAHFAPHANSRAIVSCDIARNSMLLFATDDYSGGGNRAVFASDTAGATWRPIVAASTTNPYRSGYIAGNDPHVYYLMGIGALAYSADGGANVDDRTPDGVGSARCVSVWGG